MLFSSNEFLFAFLPLVLLLYYILPRKLRNIVLLLVSLFFYGWGEPVYLFLMIGTIAVNWICGGWVARRRAKGRSAKAVLIGGVAANLLTDARMTATIGGIAIAIGVLTFSKRVMMTVGTSIATLSQVDGFVVILAMASTIVLMGEWMGIPVSTSQAVVGAVIGAGLTKGVKNVNFGVMKNIALAWVGSPTIAGALTYLVALLTKSFFA